MGDIQSMLKKMGMGGQGGLGGQGGKVNLGAMSNALNQNLKRAELKEKMLKKGEQKREQFEQKKREK
jgi:hypothetical protein